MKLALAVLAAREPMARTAITMRRQVRFVRLICDAPIKRDSYVRTSPMDGSDRSVMAKEDCRYVPVMSPAAFVASGHVPAAVSQGILVPARRTSEKDVAGGSKRSQKVPQDGKERNQEGDRGR